MIFNSDSFPEHTLVWEGKTEHRMTGIQESWWDFQIHIYLNCDLCHETPGTHVSTRLQIRTSPFLGFISLICLVSPFYFSPWTPALWSPTSPTGPRPRHLWSSVPLTFPLTAHRCSQLHFISSSTHQDLYITKDPETLTVQGI